MSFHYNEFYFLTTEKSIWLFILLHSIKMPKYAWSWKHREVEFSVCSNWCQICAKLHLACTFIFLYFHPQTLEILVYIHVFLAPSLANTMKLFMRVKNKIGIIAEIYLSSVPWKRNTFRRKPHSSPFLDFGFHLCVSMRSQRCRRVCAPLFCSSSTVPDSRRQNHDEFLTYPL